MKRYEAKFVIFSLASLSTPSPRHYVTKDIMLQPDARRIPFVIVNRNKDVDYKSLINIRRIQSPCMSNFKLCVPFRLCNRCDKTRKHVESRGHVTDITHQGPFRSATWAAVSSSPWDSRCYRWNYVTVKILYKLSSPRDERVK